MCHMVDFNGLFSGERLAPLHLLPALGQQVAVATLLTQDLPAPIPSRWAFKKA